MLEPSVIHSHFVGRIALVTGAHGFIGLQLCRALSKAGAAVHGVSRKKRSAAAGIVKTHCVDLHSSDATAQLIQSVQPDFVYHLSSRVSGSRAIDEVLPTLHGNLISTVNLLRHVTDTRCKRFVLAGSLEESLDAAPSSPYAAAKRSASMYAQMFFELYKTPITVARLFMVYGPGQHDVRKLVPYVALSLLAGKEASLSSGLRPVDWVYIDDVVDSLLGCAVDPEAIGKTVDVGTGQLTTVRSVAERICKLVGSQNGPVFGAIHDRTDEQVRAADPTAFVRMIGRPLTPIDDGLRRTVAWYRERLAAGQIDPSAID